MLDHIKSCAVHDRKQQPLLEVPCVLLGPAPCSGNNAAIAGLAPGISKAAERRQQQAPDLVAMHN